MHLNHLLRSIVEMLPHSSETERDAHLELVDAAVAPPEPEPAADGTAAGTPDTTGTTAKAK